MPSAVTAKLLHVDLATRQTRVEEIPETVLRQHLGGGALACYILLRDLPPGVDPLGPDNILVFTTSVINGLSLSGTNRYTAAAKSPLTGAYGESEAGGWWGPELRSAGYDAIAVHGQADAPVYLWIKDGKVEFRDASRYWGQLSGEVQDGLEQELGDKRIRVLQTGIAGERGVRFAAIVNQLKHFHGRSGLGAVMGAKRLKAIVVRGGKPPVAADKEGARGALTFFREHHDRSKDRFHVYGTAGGVPALEASGILPTRNFRDGSFEHFRAISGQTMADTILVNRGTCFACAVACKREVAVPELGVTPKFGGPEYESLAASGSLCGVSDLKKLALVNQLLGHYVLDSISTGVTIAFAMECYEQGILTTADTGGIELVWGNADAVVEMVHRIGRREGIGRLLGEGVKRAAAALGRGAERFALHVKGQELPMHEPRGKKSLALAYALSPTGADHMEAPHDPLYEGFHPQGHPLGPLGLIEPVKMLDFGPKKVRAFFLTQQVWSLYNSVGMCDFVGTPLNVLELEKLVGYVNSVTGWNMSLYEMLKVGERANTLQRLFNCREGFTPDDDVLPQRMHEPLGNGALKGERVDPEQFLTARRLYYQMAGWDPETGQPTPAKLAELAVDEAAVRA
ncbi:MAG TPA: aldehyde ferredoxin oxidoreductase family protein [Methylomirabilota bacterium]|jgi:aldehyde:ferredoxin oxidoreductase|nr:aldehyde ferredoxin oxidoreductase family protein [Methylomirabilota bacterium]